jgi:hypothetical protein
MIFDYDNFVFLANQVTLLDKQARKVYFSCGNSIQLNDEEFNKVLAGVTEKYEIPKTLQSVSETLQKPKNVKNKKQ